jgi:hypothetical protein
LARWTVEAEPKAAGARSSLASPSPRCRARAIWTDHNQYSDKAADRLDRQSAIEIESPRVGRDHRFARLAAGGKRMRTAGPTWEEMLIELARGIRMLAIGDIGPVPQFVLTSK